MAQHLVTQADLDILDVLHERGPCNARMVAELTRTPQPLAGARLQYLSGRQSGLVERRIPLDGHFVYVITDAGQAERTQLRLAA